MLSDSLCSWKRFNKQTQLDALHNMFHLLHTEGYFPTQISAAVKLTFRGETQNRNVRGEKKSVVKKRKKKGRTGFSSAPNTERVHMRLSPVLVA